MQTSNVRAVLFVKDLQRVAAFYAQALGMAVKTSDADHSVLSCRGFELVVHQIPQHIAVNIVIEQPPKRRVSAAIRLDYPVRDLADSRRMARSLGGDIDERPPQWADATTNLFFGYDCEGNQFGVSAAP
jgi:predicted enzyme related to lactoylglutathione lyase